MPTPETRLQEYTFDPRSIGPVSWSVTLEAQPAITMSHTSQGFPEFCPPQAMLPLGAGLMSLQAQQPASQTCSLLPLQICGLAYLPAGECRLHLGCSPQQCSHSPETPRIAWSRKAQFGDSGVLSLLYFLPSPHQPLVLRLMGMEHWPHLSLSLNFMALKSPFPSQQRQ